MAGGISCKKAQSTFDCEKEQLYDMSTDWAENHDLADKEPAILAAIAANFTVWYNSIQDSRENESKCSEPSPPNGTFPTNYTPSHRCTFYDGKALTGSDIAVGHVATADACCGACMAFTGCVASDFAVATRMRPAWNGESTGGTCHLKGQFALHSQNSGEVQTAMSLPGAEQF